MNSVFAPVSSVPYLSQNHNFVYGTQFAPCLGNVSLFPVMKFSNFSNRSSEKRVTAVALSNDGLHVCFADKFGVVWVVDLDSVDSNQALVNKKAAQMLAHYCSIITSLVSVGIF